MSNKEERDAGRRKRRVRRALLFGGLAVIGGVVISRIWKQDAMPSVLEAGSLGGLPVVYASGSGSPLVFIGQQHPQRVVNAPGIMRDYKSNIEEVIKAALEAYDKYGIRHVLLEGQLERTAREYNERKSISLSRPSDDSYTAGVEQLLNSRSWVLVPDSGDAYENYYAVNRPVNEVYNKCLAALIVLRDDLEEKTRKSPQDAAANHARLVDARAQLQGKINEAIRQNGNELVEAMFGRREMDVVWRAKDVCSRASGIVVVYGEAHGAGIQQRAAQNKIAFVRVQDPALASSESVTPYESVQKAYALPEVISR